MISTIANLSFLLCLCACLHQDISAQPLIIKSFSAAPPSVVLCPGPRWRAGGPSGCVSGKVVRFNLRVEVDEADERNLKYRYSVTGGRIIGKGPQVIWEFHNPRLEASVAEVKVRDRHSHSVSSSTRVTFESCSTCDPDVWSPEIRLSYPTVVVEGKPVLISASLIGKAPRGFPYKFKFNWTLSAGKIIKGAGKRTIKVDTLGVEGPEITATVEVDGLDPAANRTASCTIQVVRE